jgi:hypothetical protein
MKMNIERFLPPYMEMKIGADKKKNTKLIQVWR